MQAIPLSNFFFKSSAKSYLIESKSNLPNSVILCLTHFVQSAHLFIKTKIVEYLLNVLYQLDHVAKPTQSLLLFSPRSSALCFLSPS